MNFLKWLAQVPVMILVTLATYILAPVLPLLAHERDGFLDNNTRYGRGAYLPTWLSWFQTPDNSLDGDEGWRTEHAQWRFKLPQGLAVYVGRIGWLWRNPGYGFGLVAIWGIDCFDAIERGDRGVSDSPLREGSYYIATSKYWQLRYVKRLTATKCLYLNLGWNIQGALLEAKEHDDPTFCKVCSFAFSPRLATIKE
jgi:hypothetical protein